MDEPATVADCLVEAFDTDPTAGAVEFHQWYCEGEDECSCKPYLVPYRDVFMAGAKVIGAQLEPLLPAAPDEEI